MTREVRWSEVEADIVLTEPLRLASLAGQPHVTKIGFGFRPFLLLVNFMPWSKSDFVPRPVRFLL